MPGLISLDSAISKAKNDELDRKAARRPEVVKVIPGELESDRERNLKNIEKQIESFFK